MIQLFEIACSILKEREDIIGPQTELGSDALNDDLFYRAGEVEQYVYVGDLPGTQSVWVQSPAQHMMDPLNTTKNDDL